ncbi:MAG: AMP-binding protein [Acidobacteriota bacterium]
MSISGGNYLDTVFARARGAPDNVAFELAQGNSSRVLSYGELIERVRRFGQALHATGLGDGSRVAICMENRPAWPVAYLSIWYAGGVTVPLDPQTEPGALGRLFQHSGAVACVTSSSLLDKLDEACRSLEKPPFILTVNGSNEECWDGALRGEAAGRFGRPEVPDRPLDTSLPIAALQDFVSDHPVEPDAGWAPRVSPDGLGSILYTSGTTGDPKGVMIRRSAAVENIEAALKVIRFSASDRLLAVLPLFHVLPLIANCLGPMYLGARVVFLSELTAASIIAAVRRHRISVFVCVPAFFYRFHEQLVSGLEQLSPVRRAVAKKLLAVSRFTRRRLGINLGRKLLRAAHRPFGKRMRLFVTGGAKMNAEIFEQFLDWGFTLAQGYGLTEATAVLTITPLDQLRGDTVGPPISGVELSIHDPNEEGIGEVWARGPNLMDGYFNNPTATEAALVDGWLRTGDLGRLLGDGHLQITGRVKDVIVLASGKNVYPEELEGFYGQCELIEEICIVGVPDAGGLGERLHGVVVPDMVAARRRGYVNIRDMIKWELDSRSIVLPSWQRLTSLEVRTEPLPRTTTRKIRRFQVVEEVEDSRQQGQRSDQQAADDQIGGPPAAKQQAGSSVKPLEAEPDWMARVRATIARHAKTDSVRRENHLDLDLGLESLDRIELFAELQESLGVSLGDETAAELHTVGEILDALQEKLPEIRRAEVLGSDRDHWSHILAEHAEKLDLYLGRRPVAEPALWALSRGTRLGLRLLSGYCSSGQQNLPKRYPFLICANHFSYFDPFILAMALPMRVFRRCFFVGYSEYFEGWAGRRLSRWVRNIPIDPNRHLEKALQAAAEGLRRGMVLVIFPEGGRSIDGKIKEFRRGASILARQLQAPLVPAGLWGTYEMWPRGGKLQPHPVAVAFGKPLWPLGDDGGAESASALNERLRREVVELVEVACRLPQAG